MSSPTPYRAHQGGPNSTSQQQFSFSKSTRFGSIKALPYNTEFSMPYKSALSHRSSSLGYGVKLDLTKGSTLTQSAAFKQSFQSDFDRRKGQDFGTPRDGMKNTYKNTFSPDKQHQVGPGHYEHQLFHKESRFTKAPTGFSSWTDSRFKNNLGSIIINPGPQQYDLSMTNLHQKGNQYVSKFKSTGPAKINPTHSPKKSKYDSPGPAHYSVPAAIVADGKQVDSRFQSQGVRTVPHERRPALGGSLAPGPGAYNPCNSSEFQQTK